MPKDCNPKKQRRNEKPSKNKEIQKFMTASQ